MKTKDLCRRLISLMKVMNPKGDGFYAYKSDSKKFIFGWDSPKPTRNILTKGIAIYLVMSS